jgi:hypothetical protein
MLGTIFLYMDFSARTSWRTEWITRCVQEPSSKVYKQSIQPQNADVVVPVGVVIKAILID